MSKNRISAILMGFIICLVITIIVLMIKLGLRPEDTTTEAIVAEEQGVVIQEGSISTEEVIEQEPEELQEEVVEEVILVRANNTVNVRSQDSADSEKLGTLSLGEELVLVEILDSGWTKVQYNNAEGYVKSEYVEVVVPTSENVEE